MPPKITEKLREQRRLAVQRFRAKKRAEGYVEKIRWVKKEEKNLENNENNT